MFYPNSVLVSRTPGIATIWLMATLGSSRNSKKVNKQAILQIDIPEACQAVQHPDAPMALRLQSNLLYGISRAYSQKCSFFLAEAEVVQNAINKLSRLATASGLDPRAGIIRHDLLVVSEDPSIIPEINHPMIDFDARFDSSGTSFVQSDATGFAHRSSRSEQSAHSFDIPQLDIPSSGPFFGEPTLPFMPVRPSVSNQLAVELEQTDFLYDVDFEFDAAGNIIDHNTLATAPPPQSSQVGQADPFEQDTRESTRTALLSVSAQPATQPGDEPFFLEDENSRFLDATDERLNDTEISEYIEAPQTRRKPSAVKFLPKDPSIQLPFQELQRWKQDYTTYMSDITKTQRVKKVTRYAKANAAFVLGNIGQISMAQGPQTAASPLQKLWLYLLEDLIDVTSHGYTSKKSRKRRLSSAGFSSSDSENPRSRIHVDKDEKETDEKETRGDLLEDADGYTGMFDETGPSIELARGAITMIEDQSTQLPLPWSGTRAGSVHSGRLSRQASILSARTAGNTSITRAGSLNLLDRRASRLQSASPLATRTSAHTPLTGCLLGSQLDLNDGNIMFDLGDNADTSPQGPGLESQGFVSFSPTVPGHEASITAETDDFLAWIQEAVEAKKSGNMEDNEVPNNIRFDELMPTKDHARAVAAQGFLHLLTLASSGAVEVHQETKNAEGNDTWWGPLHIALAEDM